MALRTKPFTQANRRSRRRSNFFEGAISPRHHGFQRSRAVQHQPFPKAAPAPPPRLDLVEIKGFLDAPGALSAIVHVNGQRYSIAMDQPRFGDGWELVRITPEAIEVNHAGARQQVRFVSRMQAPLGGPVR